MTAFLRTNAAILTLVGCAAGIVLIAMEPWPVRAVGVALVVGGLLVPFLRLGVRPSRTLQGAISASMYETPLSKLGVDPKTVEILATRRITKVGTLLTCDPDQIVKLPGMDPQRFSDLRDVLEYHGVLPILEEAEAERDGTSTVEAAMKWLRQQPAARA